MPEPKLKPQSFTHRTLQLHLDMTRWQRADSESLQLYCTGKPRLREGFQAISATELADLFERGLEGVEQRLAGQFALVIAYADGRCRSISDRFSSHRVYYRVVGQQFRVADRVDDLAGADEPRPEIDHQAVVSYLFHHMIPSPSTLYQGVFSSAPAETVFWDGGEVSRRRWWQPQFNQQRDCTEQQFADELMELMQLSVREHCQAQKTGSFLSGGLDSSSISGLVSREMDRAKVFSIGFPVEQYNEIEYARTAVNHFGLDGYEYFMTPDDVVEALPEVVASMDQPFGNSSVMPTYFCARLAKSKGVERLIAGDGGDELFAGNVRYAQQLRLDKWRRAAGPLVGLMDLMLLRTPLPDTPALLSKAKSLTRQLKMSVPENLEYFNFLNLIDRKTIFTDGVVESVDLFGPDRACSDLFKQPARADTLDRMLYMDWKHTLADNDLVKVNSMCRLAGVEASYPMLDDRLVDFSLSVPAGIKLTPGNLRHLYKLAMKDFLPEKIINKPKHGFGLPFGIWTKEHPRLQKLAYEAIDSLKKYDLLRPGFIDEVKRLHQHEHAKHYGELVWVLMVLAIWLDQSFSKK